MNIRITDGFVEQFRVFNRGETAIVPEELGLIYIQRGVAERIEDEPEMATAPDRGQRAVRPGARPIRERHA